MLVYDLKYVLKLIIIQREGLLNINKHIYNLPENEVLLFVETYIEHKNKITFKSKLHYITS